jgi:hypothetical protein
MNLLHAPINARTVCGLARALPAGLTAGGFFIGLVHARSLHARYV